MKTRNRLIAAVSVGALGLVVACSGNGSVTPPSTNGIAPDVAAATSPIKLSVKKLDFTATGPSAAKNFVAVEVSYKGKLVVDSATCDGAIEVKPPKADGPRAKFTVTPRRATTCDITVKDNKKHEVKLPVEVKTGSPSSSPSASPSPSTSPSTGPSSSASPSASPSSNPNSIVNGNFASGSLSPGWKACSFTHYPFAAPVNPMPSPPDTVGPQSSATPSTPPIPAASLSPLALVTSPPANLNPNVSATMPPLGSHVGLAGDPESMTTGAAGICQTFTVNASSPYLSFYTWEGSTEYSFAYTDQEADILDSTGTTVKKTLFAEEDCFFDPGVVGKTGYVNSCVPPSLGGPSPSGSHGPNYGDWKFGGFWQLRGPYNLSAYAGQSITLYIGVWDSETKAGPTTYGNEVFVGNVQTGTTAATPRAVKPAGLRPRGRSI